MRHFVFRLAVAALFIASACICGYAQGGATSSLVGTVIDQSGGVIPGADVLAKNNATGAQSKAISTERGTYTIPSLGAGTYTVTVAMPGFKQAVYNNVVLVAGNPTTLRVTLSVGGTTETVIVEAGAELVPVQTAVCK